MFVGILPIMGIGYGELIGTCQKKKISYSVLYGITMLLILTTASTIIYYLLTHA
jgi:hypothetical protein